MIPVGLAICSAALFGAMTVLLRLGLQRVPDAGIGALATLLAALAVSGVAAVATGSGHAADSWPYLLTGLLAPGGSQILFTLAVGALGASRASIVVGTAPLVSVAIALSVLGEPVSAPIVLGAGLVVVGGVALVAERGRPERVRTIGLAFGAAGTVLFATRDNVVRWLLSGSAVAPVPPAAAAAATMLSGAVLVLAYTRRLPGRRALLAFAPAGGCFGLSYVCLFEAFDRGRVSVVSPLVATETLWAVGISALVLHRSELVGRRLALGAVLVVAGGALIGGFR